MCSLARPSTDLSYVVRSQRKTPLKYAAILALARVCGAFQGLAQDHPGAVLMAQPDRSVVIPEHWPRQAARYLEQGWGVSIFNVEPPSPTRCLTTAPAGSR